MPARSIAWRLGALALAALLLGGSLPWEAYAATIGAAGGCPHHGRACTCPTACKRGEPAGHADSQEAEDAGLPACHRKPAAESVDTGAAGTEKPPCTMNRCGGVEAPPPVVLTGEPYVAPDSPPAFAESAWERVLPRVLPAPAARQRKPPAPPPKTLPVRFI